jgi:hypothetical protein
VSPERQAPEPLDQSERTAAETIGAALPDHFALAFLAFNLAGETAIQVPDDERRQTDLAMKVTGHLLLRVSDDLRAASMAARHGYPLQSAGLVAGLWELALTTIHVGRDQERAQVWVDHMKPTSTPWRPQDLCQTFVDRVKLVQPEGAASRLYRVYTQLCMAKHGHPQLQMQHVDTSEPGVIGVKNGPDTSDRALRTIAFALVHGVRLTLLAQGQFVYDHLPKNATTIDLLETRKRLDSRAQDLTTEAAARWTGTDPFPGKWWEPLRGQVERETVDLGGSEDERD